MSWYRFAKDYVGSIYDQKIQQVEKSKFTNSPEEPETSEEPKFYSLENALETVRQNKITNPKLQNEVRMPIRTKANGQGQDALLNTNKDLPIYGDNFTRTNDWNTY